MTTEATIELDGQYRALREGAGIVERSGRGKLLVRGADGPEYLQSQLTNDVEALDPERGCYAALLDRKGHVQADMRVLRLRAGEIWLDLEPGAADAVVRHLRMYAIGRDVEVDDVSGRWAIISVIGPGAHTLADAPGLAPEHAQRSVALEGIEAVAVATDVGVDLVVRSETAPELHARLRDSGAVDVSEEAAEILRVESGRPRLGREMTTATLPQEAGIDERAVSFTKGCYIGQETVARLHYRGRPNRHLRGLRLGKPAADGDPITLGDREVGRVGTAVLSPAYGPIALAVVRREAEPGATVRVGDPGVDAEVVELPF